MCPFLLVLQHYNEHIAPPAMHQPNHSVQFVNTYTTLPNPHVHKPHGRKGITCVSHHGGTQPHISNDENQTPNTDVRMLAGRIRELQEQLLVMEKEKIELEKMIPDDRREGLVESHYISKKEDINQLVQEKLCLEEKVAEQEEEKHELNKHIHIREQYILKLQAQIDQGSNKAPSNEIQSQTDAALNNQDAYTQTDIVVHDTAHHYQQQHSQIQTQFEIVGEAGVQCLIEDPQLESLLEIAEHLREQDALHISTIRQLEEHLVDMEAHHSSLQKHHHELQKDHVQLQNQHAEVKHKDCKLEFELTQLIQDNAQMARLLDIADKDAQKFSLECKELRAEVEAVIISRDLHIQRQLKAQGEVQQLRIQLDQAKRMSQRWKNTQDQQEIEARRQADRLQEVTSHLNIQTSRAEDLQTVLLESQALNKHLQSQLRQKEDQLASHYNKIKRELDQVVGHLEEQSQIITRQQLKVRQEERQLREVRQGEQAEFGSIVSHYQQRVRDIQGAFEGYVEQLKRQTQQNQFQFDGKGELLRKIELQQVKVADLTVMLSARDDKIARLSEQLAQAHRSASPLRRQKQGLERALRMESQDHKGHQQQVDQLLCALQREKEERLLITQELAREQQSKRLQIEQLRGLIDSLSQYKAEVDDRMVVVKRDYDVLYAKYAKYKAIARTLKH